MTTTRSGPRRIAWFLSGDDGRDHAITPEEFGRARAPGELHEAVCGHRVRMISCMNPPGPHCPRCEAYLSAQASLPNLGYRLDPGMRSHRKPSLWRRLLGRPGRSADPEGGTRDRRPGDGRGGHVETPTSGVSAAYQKRDAPCRN